MEINNAFFESYILKDMIGKGAFGSVWKAENTHTKVEVAVKVIDRR